MSRKELFDEPFAYGAMEPKAAIGAVSKAGAKLISSGTNLLDLMKLEIEQPTHLVDISRLSLNDIDDLLDPLDNSNHVP